METLDYTKDKDQADNVSSQASYLPDADVKNLQPKSLC